MQSDTTLEALVGRGERFSRRKMLECITGAVVAGSALPWLAGCDNASNMVVPVATLYPALNGQYGDILPVGVKADFPAATPDTFKLNQAGIFYQQPARTYIIHLAKETPYLLTGTLLEEQLAIEAFAHDQDGSYWLALYQRCVHLGTKVAFREDCLRFKCPSHGAQYHCDGEYLTGPAPRSMDRFPLYLQDENVLVDTSKIINSVVRPDDSLRLLSVPLAPCE